MQKEIIEKLNQFLKEKLPFNEECQVVYFMVEIRKILDRQKEKNNQNLSPLIRFYCDWTLHTEKSKITPEIKQIMSKIDETLLHDTTSPQFQLSQRENLNFIYMRALREELGKFLQSVSLDTTLIDDEEKWISFVKIIVKVLVNQSIRNPNPNIEEFYFKPAKDGAGIWVIKFRDDRGFCKFGNHF